MASGWTNAICYADTWKRFRRYFQRKYEALPHDGGHSLLRRSQSHNRVIKDTHVGRTAGSPFFIASCWTPSISNPTKIKQKLTPLWFLNRNDLNDKLGRANKNADVFFQMWPINFIFFVIKFKMRFRGGSRLQRQAIDPITQNGDNIYTDDRVIAATPRLRTRIIGVNDAYRAASAIVCVQLLDYTRGHVPNNSHRRDDKSTATEMSRCRGQWGRAMRLVILRRKLLEVTGWKDDNKLRFPWRRQ